MAKRRRPRRRDEEYLDDMELAEERHASEPDDDYARERSRNRRRRASGRGWWMWRLGLLGVVSAVVVWFLPAIACSPPVWGYVLSTINGKLNGRVEMSRPSLSWLSPVVIKDVKVHSLTEENLVTVEEVRTERSLLGLATSPSNLGVLTLTRPTVRASVRAEGSNLEDLILPQDEPQPSEAGATSRMALALRVIEAKVEIRDETTGDDYQIEPLNAVVSLPASSAQEGQAEIDASFAAGSGAAARQAGAVNAKLRWLEAASPEAGLPVAACLVDAHVASLDLGALQPLLKRVIPGLQLQGTLSCQAKAHLDETAQKRSFDLKQLAGDRLVFAAPGILGQDVVRLDQVKLRGKIESEGRDWTIHDLQLESDLAQLKAEGRVQLGDGSLANVAGALGTAGKDAALTADARLDLARLAQLLPNTLHLKEGTAVSDGDVTASIKVEPTGNGPKLSGRVQMSDLVAQNAGRTIRWQQPLTATFAALQSPQGVAIEQLQCDASFLKVTGSGALEKGQIHADGDLAQLAAELGQMVDFGEIHPSGAIALQLDWQQQANDNWVAKGEAKLTNLAVALAGGKTWKETELIATVDVQGKVAGAELRSIDRGTFTVRAGEDQLDAALLRSVAIGPDAVWPLSAKVHGDVAAWLARATPFADLKDVALTGTADLNATAEARSGAVAIQEIKLTADDLRGRVNKIFLDEPRIEAQASAAWDGKSQSLHVPEATFASSTIAFRVDRLEARFEPQNFYVSGGLDYRAKVDQLSRWFHDPQEPLLGEYRGDLEGKLTINVQNGVTIGQLDCEVAQLAYAEPPAADAQKNLRLSSVSTDRWQVKWQEPKVMLGGQITYDPASDTLKLSKASAQAASISMSATGEISAMSSPQAMCNLVGELAYDMADVTQKLQPYAGPTLSIEGKERRQFALKGPLTNAKVEIGQPADAAPLVSPELTGEAGLGWATAAYGGFVFGPADLKARLERGELSLAPFQLAVGEGKISGAPKVLLNDPHMMLLMPPGPVIEQVRLSPEMCQMWLKFVAPLAADATRAEGKFSLTLDETAVPLTEPQRADVAGNLVLHGAQIGPGPLAQPIIKLVSQVRGILDGQLLPTDVITGLLSQQPQVTEGVDGVWMKLPEQNVEFRVVDGKVHHRGLKFTVKDVEVTTEGAVGFDQSYQIVISIPLTDGLIKDNAKPEIKALKGQTIKIPAHGKLGELPQLDASAFKQLGTQLAGGAIKNLLKDKVGGAVDGGVAQGTEKVTEKVNELQEGLKNKVNQEITNGLRSLFGPKK